MSILRNLLRSGLGDVSDAAFAEIQRRQSRPCAQYLYHVRQLEKLDAKSRKGRVFALRLRLAHHRLWRRHWESKCEALNDCDFEKGC